MAWYYTLKVLNEQYNLKKKKTFKNLNLIYIRSSENIRNCFSLFVSIMQLNLDLSVNVDSSFQLN